MKVFKRFYMDKSHPLCTLMFVEKDPFRPQENDEELLILKVPYLSVIGTLTYLVNYS